VSHAKLTIFEVSPTLSNLTKLGSMCIPSHYAALFAATGDIFCDGELFVMNHIKDKMDRNKKFPGYGRALLVVEMIRTGLDLLQSDHLPLKLNLDLPVFFATSNNSGCGIKDKFDEFGYPHVVCYVPLPEKYGQNWCKTIGVPTYEIWKWFKKYESESSLDVQL
jgi:hypothetical protein